MSRLRLISSLTRTALDYPTCHSVLSSQVTLVQARSKHSTRTRHIRQPLKKFVPSTRHSDKNEIDDILAENELKYGVVEDTEFMHPFVKDENLKNDHLPEGLTLDQLPKFEKILGWDKTNPTLKKIKKQIEVAKKPHGKTVLLEGKRVIVDAMNSGLYPKTFIFSRLNLLDEIPFDLENRLNMVQIPYRNVQAWSELTTSPGIMAIFDLEEIELSMKDKINSSSIPLTMILDNVRTPDNIGALIRVGAAVGCQRIITTKGCVDAWNPKAIRAGAGAHFKISIANSVPWSLVPKLLNPGCQVYLADNTSGPFGEQDPEKLRELLAKCSSMKTDQEDLSYLEPEILAEFSQLPLPVISLENLPFSSNSAVILGGETHGLSAMAKKCAHEHLGAKLNIPLSNQIESLNVACAASIILYQFLFRHHKGK